MESLNFKNEAAVLSSPFSKVPYDVTFYILTFCNVDFQTVHHWSQACQLHHSVFKQAQEFLYYGICRQKGYLTFKSSSVNADFRRAWNVDTSNLKKMLRETLDRQHGMNNTYQSLSSWKQFAEKKSQTLSNWRCGKSKRRIQFGSSQPDENVKKTISDFKCHPQRKVWTTINGSGTLSVRNSVGVEIWTWSDSFHHVGISGDYVVASPRFHNFRVWKISDVQSQLDDEQEHEVLVHHGFIEHSRASIQGFILRAPYLVTTAWDDDLVRVWNVETLEEVQSFAKPVDTRFRIELDDKYVMINDMVDFRLKSPDEEKFETIQRHTIPPLPRSAAEQTFLKPGTWSGAHHDTRGNHLVAVDLQGLFLWIQHYQQFLDGSKTWQQCATYATFSYDQNNAAFLNLCVENGKAIVTLASTAQIEFEEFAFTTLFVVELKNWNNRDEFCHNPPLFQTIATVMPNTKRIQADDDCIYVTGRSELFEEPLLGLHDKVEIFLNQKLENIWSEYRNWKEVDGTQLCQAWKPPTLDLVSKQVIESSMLEGFKILREGKMNKWLSRSEAPPDCENNVIVAYDFSGSATI